jgi:hypothetical protein
VEAAARLMATTTAPARPDERPLDRAGRALRAVPWAAVWLAIVVLWIASRWIVGPGFQSLDNIWAVVTAASFIAVAAAGQGLVILTGGIDLSIPWMMTLGGVLIAKWTNGQNRGADLGPARVAGHRRGARRTQRRRHHLPGDRAGHHHDCDELDRAGDRASEHQRHADRQRTATAA